MSVRESFEALREPPSEHGEAGFRRWPGLLSLTLGLLLGPIVALANQQMIYSANMWACGNDGWGAMHLIPLLCLIVAIGAALTAYRDWKAVGRDVNDEEATVAERTRFVALCGIFISAFSALVILSQWAAIFVFAPCMQA